MKLRLSSTGRPILMILVIAMLGVGLACAGEKATPTSPPTATTAPTATATTPPTATLVPTATATLVPGAPTPTATAIPTATSTAVPEPTATAVPFTWIEKYMQSTGYKPEWGQPQTGGILKYRLPVAIANFNPNPGNVYVSTVTKPTYNSLIRVDPWIGFSSIIPDLAKSWEISSDGLQFTFKLEEGVKFQDNPNIPERLRSADFTCEDVQASVERFVRPPSSEKIPQGKVMLGHVNSVSCPDGALGYTAVMNLDLPKAKTLVSIATGLLVMMDKDFVEWLHTEKPGALEKSSPEFFRLNMGTGPFVPLEHQPDVITKTRRNPTYWREGLPLLDGYDFYILKDYTTAFTALATGQIHGYGQGTTSMLPGQVIQAERDFKDRVVVLPAVAAGAYGVKFNIDRVPFNDLRVRKAMNLALDRDDWLLFRKAGSYAGAKIMGIMTPGTYWSHTEAELRTWPGLRQPKDQDVAEANRLLDEVFGKGKRFSTTCTALASETYAETCMFFADQMKRHLNIDINLRFLEKAVMTEAGATCQYEIAGGFQLGIVILDPDDSILDEYHREYATSAGGQCWLAGADPDVQAQLEAELQAQSDEMDLVKRREMSRSLDRKIFQDIVYHVTEGWTVLFYGTTPQVKGYSLYDYFNYSNFALYERVWLAK